jgi:hypothetical protein
MYIVAIAWLYVTLMVSVAQPSVLKGVLTFLGTGLLPLALFLWLIGTPERRRRRAAREAAQAGASASSPAPRGSGEPEQ